MNKFAAKKFFCICAFSLLALLCEAGMASAELALNVPERAAAGDAFLAELVSTEPVDEFIVNWLGKTHKIKAKTASQGRSEAQILLPVPLDEKSRALNLKASAQQNGKKTPASLNVKIEIYDKQRPSEKLTVDKKYVNPPASVQKRLKDDREKVRQALSRPVAESEWTLPFARPVPGAPSSVFGKKRVFNGQPRSVHRGLDLRGAAGSPIKACANGEVILVDNLYYSGNAVYVDHGGGVVTAYLHMTKPLVEVGQKVKRGDPIGLVGATGRVTGPHLHLTLLVQGQSVDPLPFLETQGAKGK